MGFSRHQYWSEFPFPPLADLPDPVMEPMALKSPALAGGSLSSAPPGVPYWTCIFFSFWVSREAHLYNTLVQEDLIRFKNGKGKNTDVEGIQKRIPIQELIFQMYHFQNSIMKYRWMDTHAPFCRRNKAELGDKIREEEEKEEGEKFIKPLRITSRQSCPSVVS